MFWDSFWADLVVGVIITSMVAWLYKRTKHPSLVASISVLERSKEGMKIFFSITNTGNVNFASEDVYYHFAIPVSYKPIFFSTSGLTPAITRINDTPFGPADEYRALTSAPIFPHTTLGTIVVLIKQITKSFRDDNGPMFIDEIASTTGIDLTAERMAKAITRMAVRLIGKPLREKHQKGYLNKLDEIVQAGVISHKDNSPALWIKARLHNWPSAARDSFGTTTSGVKLGLFVTGQVNPGGIVKQLIESVGKYVLTYVDVESTAVSVTDHPANLATFALAVAEFYIAIRAVGSSQLWVMNADGTGKRLLKALVSHFAWSPDNSTLAVCYSSTAGIKPLYLLDAGGNGMRNIAGANCDKAMWRLWEEPPQIMVLSLQFAALEHREFAGVIYALVAGYLSISTVTRLEVHVGMAPTERYATQKLLACFSSYELDDEISERAGNLVRDIRSRGEVMSAPDALIAATAITHNLTLVTFNRAHFERIPGLSLEPLPEEPDQT
jgi:tRNA(fMet)-specific endonuclease VapC